MSPMFTHSNTPTFAKNGTAGTTTNTTSTRAQAMVPTGGNRRLTQIQKASHVAEMTQDGFTLVDRSKTYTAVAASKGTPQKKHQMVAHIKENTDIDRPATIRGVLTTAIDNQQVITTKVTLLEQEMERRKVLIKALDKMKLCKALYKAFGVKATEPQAGPTIAPLSSLPSKHPKATMLGCGVDQASPILGAEQALLSTRISSIQTPGPCEVKSVIMRGQNHSYSLSALNRQIFPKKPTIGHHPAGHYVVPPTKDLKQSRECFHCHNKGHYARNCRIRKKAMCEAPPATIRTTSITNDNRYKALEEESLEKPKPPMPTQFIKAIQNLSHSMLTMKQPVTPQGTKRLDAKEIKELVQTNVT